ncbi:hypothetical protein VTJ83DRAFT_3898 [Remersonia thermophila]|uniref:Uncharacterized protein n=1 Tax=Remersonia thermophila TaxID=72144 RepID=A0ABR4DFL1_9PEZI
MQLLGPLLVLQPQRGGFPRRKTQRTATKIDMRGFEGARMDRGGRNVRGPNFRQSPALTSPIAIHRSVSQERPREGGPF